MYKVIIAAIDKGSDKLDKSRYLDLHVYMTEIA